MVRAKRGRLERDCPQTANEIETLGQEARPHGRFIMSSKRRIRRNACKGKQVYGSEEQAKEVARFIGRRRGDYMVAYRCEFCHHWHHGHSGTFNLMKAFQRI